MRARVGRQELQSGSRIIRAGNNMRKTIIGHLSQADRDMECCICTMNFENDQKAIVFACHPKHMMHEECYNEFVKSFEGALKPLLCPMCRKPVDKTRVVKKKLIVEPEPPEDDRKAVFGLESLRPED